MIDHAAVQSALRTRLLTLSVCTTGLVPLSATSTGYARSVGSFVDDGFVVGTEITPAGFAAPANLTTSVITAVDDLTITCPGRTNEIESAGRSLSVDLPVSVAWENIAFTPVIGTPYLVEQYVPGPTAKATLGAFGELEVLPMYIPLLYVPSNYGNAAAQAYATAILTLFAPETSLTLASGSLRVRGDVAPSIGQLTQTTSGFAAVPITIPLRYRVQNAL